jgi:hypothetical protein
VKYEFHTPRPDTFTLTATFTVTATVTATVTTTVTRQLYGKMHKIDERGIEIAH